MLKRLSLPAGLCVLAAALPAQVVDHVDRPLSPIVQDVRRAVAADLDSDLRDDAVFVLGNGKLVRAANPGISQGSFLFGGLTDVVDAVGVRLPARRDVIVSVGSGSGLVVHSVAANGSVLSVPSTTTNWTGVTRLRVFDLGRFPLFAGISANGQTVRLASLDPATNVFYEFTTLTALAPLLDLEFAQNLAQPMPHLVALTASALTRYEFNGTLRGSPVPLAAVAGSLARMPDVRDIACVTRSATNAPWELFVEHDGGVGTSVPLTGFAPSELDAMDIRDFEAGNLDGDPYPDLLIGQSSSGLALVLFGQSSGVYGFGSYSVLGSPDTGGIAGIAAPPIVALVDGTVQEGVFQVSDTTPSMRVHYRIPSGQAVDGSLDDFLPSIVSDLGYSDPLFRVPTWRDGMRVLNLRMKIPAALVEAARADSLNALQISVWTITGLVDAAGHLTWNAAAVELAMRSDFAWTLNLPPSGSGDRIYRLPIPIDVTNPEFQEQRKHVMLMTRLVRLDGQGSAASISAASFTTPFWFSKHWRDSASNLVESEVLQLGGPLEALLWNTNDPPVSVDGDVTGSKNIARLRRAKPIAPPMPGPPVTANLTNNGAAQQ